MRGGIEVSDDEVDKITRKIRIVETTGAVARTSTSKKMSTYRTPEEVAP
jgi:hypothetical protein